MVCDGSDSNPHHAALYKAARRPLTTIMPDVHSKVGKYSTAYKHQLTRVNNTKLSSPPNVLQRVLDTLRYAEVADDVVVTLDLDQREGLVGEAQVVQPLDVLRSAQTFLLHVHLPYVFCKYSKRDFSKLFFLDIYIFCSLADHGCDYHGSYMECWYAVYSSAQIC